MKRRQWRSGSDWGWQAVPHSWCSHWSTVVECWVLSIVTELVACHIKYARSHVAGCSWRVTVLHKSNCKVNLPRSLYNTRSRDIHSACTDVRAGEICCDFKHWRTPIDQGISLIFVSYKDYKLKSFPEPGPWGGADLRFLSPQPDTSRSGKTTDTEPVHRVVCPFTFQLSLVVINRPRRDGTLSWRRYTAAMGGIRTRDTRSQDRHRSVPCGHRVPIPGDKLYVTLFAQKKKQTNSLNILFAHTRLELLELMYLHIQR